MPYRWGVQYVGFFFLVTIWGFWGSYFTRFADVPMAFHVHAFTALAWLLLLGVQVWSIQSRRNGLHRALGLASFALFPLLILGLVMIVNRTAQMFAARDPARLEVGPAIAALTLVAVVAYLALYFLALRHRRNVRLHAGYMLATPLVLFESGFSRVMLDYLPWTIVTGREGAARLYDSIAIADGIAILFALGMYFNSRRGGVPWLVAAGLVGAQIVLLYSASHVPAAHQLLDSYSHIPQPVTLLGAIAIGGMTAWAGWRLSAPRGPGGQVIAGHAVSPGRVGGPTRG